MFCPLLILTTTVGVSYAAKSDNFAKPLEGTVGKHLIGVKVERVESRQSDRDEPQTWVYFRRFPFTIGQSQWIWTTFSPDMPREKICPPSLWHSWIGAAPSASEDPTEWWPTTCKPPSPPPIDDPARNTYMTNNYKYSLPLPLLSRMFLGNETLVLRVDSPEYKQTNAVCRAGHHFYVQPKPAALEGSLPWDIWKDGQRPIPEVNANSTLRKFFTVNFDKCALLRHPCWCNRAPPSWNCISCKLHKNFDSRWHCYEKSTAGADWCRAVTIRQPDYNPILIPVAQDLYNIYLQRNKTEPELLVVERIFWLPDDVK